MRTDANRILLFRSPSDPDRYAEVFAEAGFVATSVPVLAFAFVGQEALRTSLEHPHRYGGLVLTSPRAVDALTEVLPWLPSENASWHAKPVFTVGPATAGALRKAGFSPEGEESGSAARLCEMIARRAVDAPLLFLCGDRRLDVLPDRLKQAGVPYEELCVYETRTRSPLDLSDVPAPGWAAFFSPSGVAAVCGATGIDWRGVRRAAIGQTTAQALVEHGWPPDVVADEPSPEGLVRAIRAAGDAG